MRIILYNQYYLFEDYPMEKIEKILENNFQKDSLPDWIVVALIDEKLARNEWYYNDN